MLKKEKKDKGTEKGKKYERGDLKEGGKTRWREVRTKR